MQDQSSVGVYFSLTIPVKIKLHLIHSQLDDWMSSTEIMTREYFHLGHHFRLANLKLSAFTFLHNRFQQTYYSP